MKHDRTLSVFRELRESAGLRLEVAGGKDVAHFRETNDGAEFRVTVPSKQLVEFLDSFRLSRGERLLDRVQVADLIELMRAVVHAPENEPAAATDLSAFAVSGPTGYVPRRIGPLTDVEVCRRAAVGKRNVLLVGPPGSGKTLLAKTVAQVLDRPFVRLDLHQSFDPDDFFGRYERDGGSWRWRDSAALAACRTGGVLVLDELDSADPRSVSRLHGLLDSRRLVVIEHESEVVDASGAAIVATANSPEYGGRELSPRLAERFPVRLNIGWDPNVEARLFPDAVALGSFAALREDPAIRTPPSTRLLVSYRDNRRAYGAPVAYELLLAHFRPDERESVAETFRLAGTRARAVPS